MTNPIQIWDPKTQSYFEEKVLGASWINLAYTNPLIKPLASSHAFQRGLSKLVEAFQNSTFSRKKIESFIKEFQIQPELFEVPADGYENFNEFFVRKIKNPHGYFQPLDKQFLRSPVEARLTVFEFKTDTFETNLVIKEKTVPLKHLLGPTFLALNKTTDFGLTGHAWVFRLCPVDYHRFHFFDSGRASKPVRIPGLLHSVNPLSLQTIPDVFLQNERQITILKTDHLGSFFYLEVGALCVGKIVQTFDHRHTVNAGDEKGFFEFGGSTVILVSFSKWVKPTAELVHQTQKGFETKVFLGDKIGKRVIDC